MSDFTTQHETASPKTGNVRGASHWRSKTRRQPLEHDRALRQGRISNCAFIALGREEAIAFLNTDNLTLGGRPLDIATASVGGEDLVTREIERLRAVNFVPAAPTSSQDVP